ncbi:MAG: hypothetical protein KME22_15515 [Hassallia sp. WJT32-NPBG1]|jgi:hypothetical protein|nr:hypothetical protein [Hassallia sp. WJT32-NPBG1]
MSIWRNCKSVTTHKLENHSVVQPTQEDVAYHCPCCGYKTLSERGGYEICPVCFWEDDGQDEEDKDVIRGGPNGELNLTSQNQLPNFWRV